jgi:hypothetical protein
MVRWETKLEKFVLVVPRILKEDNGEIVEMFQLTYIRSWLVMALLLTASVILLALVHVHAVACLALVEPRRAEAHLRIKYFLDLIILKAVVNSILDLV